MLVKAAGLYVFTVGSCLVTEAFRPPAQFLSSSRIQHASKNSNALSASTSDAIVSSDVWWKEGLKFGCTACGRCCQNEGEVWLDADEFADLSNNLKESPKAVLEKYSERTMSGWVKLKNQISDDPKINDRCIFLGEDGKQCSIYESRPIQCRTYPFWPRLLSNTDEWNKEGVQPDHVELVEGSADRHWTPATGGCEGNYRQNVMIYACVGGLDHIKHWFYTVCTLSISCTLSHAPPASQSLVTQSTRIISFLILIILKHTRNHV
jgi:uncharacterized protein